MDAHTAGLLAAIIGLLGSVILAFSLNSVLTEMHIAIEAISTSIESLAGNHDIYVFTGLDERIQKAKRVSSSWVRAGIYCLIASTFLAVWSLYAEQSGSGAAPKASSNWLHFSGFYGIVVGIVVLGALWLLIWIKLNGTEFHFDAQGKEGSFESVLSNYLDLAKFVLGLASGSIVLLVGSATFRDKGYLLTSFAAPLYLLALSIIYGIVFMSFIVLNYEGYRHKTQPYTRFRYSRNMAFGFGCLSCFAIGYAWLIVIVTGTP
jgi:hypothetical protein